MSQDETAARIECRTCSVWQPRTQFRLAGFDIDGSLRFAWKCKDCENGDLNYKSRDELLAEVVRLRDGIRQHRELSGHALCWFVPELWGLVPDGLDAMPYVPPREEFLAQCSHYRNSLDSLESQEVLVGWAMHYIAKLKKGETVSFRPRGNSMEPKVKSGQLCTVEPIVLDVPKAGDVVLCKVHGREYLHLVSAVRNGEYQISNNKGYVNGWVGPSGIYGRLVKVED